MEIQAYRHEITGGERGGKKGGGREEWGPEGKNCTVQCTQHGDTVNKMTGKFKNISIKTIQYKERQTIVHSLMDLNMIF